MRLREHLNEEIETSSITITVRKGSGSGDVLYELLRYIKSIGNVGHSFKIVVDPDDKDCRKSFYWDGDGSDYIKDIKVE